MVRLVRARWIAPLLVVLAAGAAGAYLVTARGSNTRRAEACAGERAKAESERGRETEQAREREREGRAAHSAPAAIRDLYTGPPEQEPPGGEGCEQPGHPETFADLAKANGQRVSRAVAPGTEIKRGAYRAAVVHAAAMPATGGAWKPYGSTPLRGNDTDYDQSDGSTRAGLPGLSGRATAFAHDDAGSIYLAVSNGGVWKSSNAGSSWTSIGQGLPTQVVSSVAWTPTGGGTLVALTGDNAYGGDTYSGLGAYYTRDGGKTWRHSSGIPDGILGFKLAVDPSDRAKVYAATGGGLYRSTDAGASFVNVNLPTGKGAQAPTPDCSGKTPFVKGCFLANMVTDVVVQGQTNLKTPGAKPGAVLAAVGWRGGRKKNADGGMQSPGNGIYVSSTGAPNTFANKDLAGHATPVPPLGNDALTQDRIGRVQLGIASGPAQNHNIVYAIVQDAVKFNGGVTGLDVDEPGTTNAAQSDYLNGIWVSTDFGTSWKQLEGASAIDNDPSSGSALSPPVCKAPLVVSYCPGIQAWYNEFIEPDPTQATATGVPTRLVFGLEEVWANASATTPPTGLDGAASMKFGVVGRYYADESCTLLNATNGLPVCPTMPQGVPKTTTHPDQHGAMWVPEGNGGAALYVANDGGVFRQHVSGADDIDPRGWGDGANIGLNTLQPYDAEMAKDGTVYMGLQDNGEAKIDPSGRTFTVFGGDGGFTAVDPDHADTAYEEYVGGEIRVTTDGGKNWDLINPTLTSPLFITPFQMDPASAAHLLIGAREVYETTAGSATTSDSWSKVFDLGTQKHPGDAGAAAADDDPDNQTSALDVRGFPVASDAPTGPHTANQDYGEVGGSTVPGGTGDQGTGIAPTTYPPGTYEDRPFTVGPKDGDAAVNLDLTWADPTNDWDLYLYRKASDGSLTQVGSSADGNTTSGVPTEHISYPNPAAGDYVVRVVNFAATGTAHLTMTFAQRTSATRTASSAYVGYCGFCDVITQGVPFGNGIATNVAGDKPGDVNSPDGWHIAAAKGLPTRYITSVRMDPTNPRTVYVTLAGYGRRWAQPGALGEDTSKIGTGHVFKSTDAGQTFRDVSGNLPDIPANWSVLHNGHLVVGTDIGVFESCDTAGGAYSALGTGLPTTPVSTLRYKPGDPDLLVAATYGRGVYTYRFGTDSGRCTRHPRSPHASSASTRLIRSYRVLGTRFGSRLRAALSVTRTATARFVVRRGGKVVARRTVHLRARQTRRIMLAPRQLARGRYRVTLRVTSGEAHASRTLRARRR